MGDGMTQTTKPRPIPFDMYTATAGCTTCAAGGERGTVTAFHYLRGARGPVAAFVRREDGEMWVIELGDATRERSLDGHVHHHRITGGWRIDRDEFDRIVGINTMRREMGWVE